MLWLLLFFLVAILGSLFAYKIKKHAQPRIWEDSDEEVQRLPVQKKRAEPIVIEKVSAVQEEARRPPKQKVSLKQAVIYSTVFEKPVGLREFKND